MKLTITAPESFCSERNYITDVLIGDFLGIKYSLSFVEGQHDTRISFDGSDNIIVMPDIFFSVDDSDWLTQKNLPSVSIKYLNISVFPGNPVLCSEMIPVLFGTEVGEIEYSNKNIHIPVDIFGSSFFMLSRYEEVVSKEKDRHDRFSAGSSISFREKFLNRPIVNEYLEILWSAMKTLWAGIERKERKFQMVLSHDVDRPFQFAFMRFFNLTKLLGADIIKRRSIKAAFGSLANYIAVKSGNVKKDPYNTFDMIMDLSESIGVKSCFYFISDSSDNRINGDYNIDHPYIVEIMKKIKKRGHEIGLHLSYDSFLSAGKIKDEFDKLVNICFENGIEQERWGSRQHYLRFSVPQTWSGLADAGICYDSSVGFADHAGFRCGVCYDFPVYDVLKRKRLSIIERPLIVMERTVLDSCYMNLNDIDIAARTIKELMDKVSLFNGNFVLLWHNNRFLKENERNLYCDIIRSSQFEQ